MLPNIANAKIKLVFQLNDVYRAALCTEIEAPGLIQYHHLLMIFEAGKQPVLCIGAEWGRLDPESAEKPVLGHFDADGHHNHGNSHRWRDEALFLLEAVKFAREFLQTTDLKLVEGEIWALAEIRRKLDLVRSGSTECHYAEEYRSALYEYRERYMH